MDDHETKIRLEELRNARIAAYTPMVAAVVAAFVSVASMVAIYKQQQKVIDVQIMKTSNEFELGLIKAVSTASQKERKEMSKMGDAFYFHDDDTRNDGWWCRLRMAIYEQSAKHKKCRATKEQ